MSIAPTVRFVIFSPQMSLCKVCESGPSSFVCEPLGALCAGCWNAVGNRAATRFAAKGPEELPDPMASVPGRWIFTESGCIDEPTRIFESFSEMIDFWNVERRASIEELRNDMPELVEIKPFVPFHAMMLQVHNLSTTIHSWLQNYDTIVKEGHGSQRFHRFATTNTDLELAYLESLVE